MTTPANSVAVDVGERTDVRDSLLRIIKATLLGLLIFAAWIGLPLNTPFVAYGAASAFVLQVLIRPRTREILGVVLTAAAADGLEVFLVPQSPHTYLTWTASFGLLGLSSFAWVGFRAVWAPPQELEQLKSILITASAFTFFILASQRLLNIGGMLFPNTLDLYAYAFDGSLGFQPSFVVGSLFAKYPWISAFGHFTYLSLPLPMALICAAHLKKKASSPLFILEVFMAAGIFGYFLYLVFPAAGPRYVAGPEFPGSPLSLSALRELKLRAVPLNWTISRNAMPSLHAAWALLIWFNCKPFSRWVRALGLMFVFVTLFDTLGTGEHYLIDLVVAFPFAVAIQALCTRAIPLRLRLIAIVGGFSFCLVWSLLLRYATDVFLLNPILPWASIAITIVLSALSMNRILTPQQLPISGAQPLARANSAGI